MARNSIGFMLVAGAVFVGYEAVQTLRHSKPATNAPGGSASLSPGANAGGSVGGPVISGSRPANKIKEWIDAAIALTGVSRSEWEQPLANLVQTESTGNPTAVNPLHVWTNSTGDVKSSINSPGPGWIDNGQATGLAQTLPGTFNQYNPTGVITNPVDNLVAAIRYIQARYGSINDPTLQAREAAGIGY